MPGSIDFLLMSESIDRLGSGGRHVIWILFYFSEVGEDHIRYVDVFCLCITGGVSGKEASIDDLIVCFYFVG